jgi:hypothetical protein
VKFLSGTSVNQFIEYADYADNVCITIEYFYRFILQPKDDIKRNLSNKKKGAEDKIKNLEASILEPEII